LNRTRVTMKQPGPFKLQIANSKFQINPKSQ
jgi:hypothetical protein